MPLGRMYVFLGYVGPSGVESGPVCVCVCVCACVCVCVHSHVYVCSVTQLHLTGCDPMDHSPPGSSAHGFPKQEY